MRALAWTAGSVAGLALALYAAGYLLLGSVPLDPYREPLIAQISKITGREVHVGSVSRFSGVLRPRVVIEDLRILADTPGEEIARVEHAAIGLDLLPLFRGVLHVAYVELQGVELTIVTDARGKIAWLPNTEAAEAGTNEGGVEVAIEDLDIEEARIEYRDGVTGDTTRTHLTVLRLDVHDAGRAFDIEASGELDELSFSLEGAFERVPGAERGFTGTLEGHVGPVTFEAAGRVDTPLELAGVDLALTARLPDLSLLLDLAGLPDPGTVVATARVRDTDGQIGLEDVTIEIAGGGMRASARGFVRDVIGSPEVLLQVDAELASLSLLAPVLDIDVELPDLAPVIASATLSADEDRVDLRDLELVLGSEANGATASGSVLDIGGLRTVELEVSVVAADVRDLAPGLRGSLSALDSTVFPLRGTARIAGSREAIHVESLDVRLGDSELWLEVSGSADVLDGDVDLRLAARFAAAKSSDLALFVPVPLPDVGPLSGSADVRGSLVRTDLARIEVAIGRPDGLHGEISGEVRDLQGIARARLRVHAVAPSALGLQPLIEAYTDYVLPDLGRVEAWSEVVRTREGIELREFRAVARRDDGLELRVEGESSQVPFGLETEVRVALEAPELRRIGSLIDEDLPSIGPVRASGRLIYAQDRVALHDFEAQLDRTKVTGWLRRVVGADGRPRITAALETSELLLPDIVDRAPAAGETAPPGSFWTDPLDMSGLHAQDADLVLRVGKVSGGSDLGLEDLVLHVSLDRGVLNVNPLSMRFQGGSIEAELRVDATRDPPAWRARADGHGIDLARVAAQFTASELVSGDALIAFELEGAGATPRDIVRSLDGEVTLVLRDGHLGSEYALLLQSSILRASTFRGKVPEAPRIGCLIADFDFVKGVLTTEEVLLEGDQALLHVTGNVDFPRERYDLLLTPSPKKPQLFSVIVPVTVTGSLASPKVRASKMALARDASKAVVANLLVPGLGLLAPFLRTGTLGRDPCADAVLAYLGGTEPDTGVAAGP